MLELSLREALQLRHKYISTEYVLLGLVGDPDGVAVRALARLGIEPGEVRRETMRVLGGGRVRAPETTPGRRARRTCIL